MPQSQTLDQLPSDRYSLIPLNPVDLCKFKRSLRDTLQIRAGAGFKYGLLFYALYNIDADTVQYSYLMDYELQDLITSGCLVASKVVCVFDREHYLNRKGNLISTIRSDPNWTKIQLKQREPTGDRLKAKIVQEQSTQPLGLQRTKDMKITPKLSPNQTSKNAVKQQPKVSKQRQKLESKPQEAQKKPQVHNKPIINDESSEEYEYKKQDYKVQNDNQKGNQAQDSKPSLPISSILIQLDSQSEDFQQAIRKASKPNKPQLSHPPLKAIEKPILKNKSNLQRVAVKPTTLKNQSTMLNYYSKKSS